MKIKNGFITNEAGENVFLVGPDHEAELVDCNTENLDKIHDAGCNCFTATLLGGDLNGQSGKANVHPFNDRSKQVEGGYNVDVLNKWKEFFQHWHRKYDGNKYICLMLSEWENHNEIRNWQMFWSEIVHWFREFNIIWYFEEIPIGPGEQWSREDAIDRLTFLKSIIPTHHLVGLHNPTDPSHNRPWRQLQGLMLVDVVMLQTSLENIDQHSQEEFSFMGGQSGVIASERTPANLGFKDGSPSEFVRWCSPRCLSGGLAYLGPHDLQPITYDAWLPMFRAVTQPDANVAGASITNAFWRVAPWVAAEATWKAGAVDIADNMAIRCEPGQIAAIETRVFVGAGHSVEPEPIPFWFSVEGNGVPEIRCRAINAANEAKQISSPRSASFESSRLDGDLELGGDFGNERLCFDVLNFSPQPVTVRLKRVSY